MKDKTSERNRGKKVSALLVAGTMAFSSVATPVGLTLATGASTVAYAATVDKANIDRDHAVSLTLHKYDHMKDATVNADGTVASAKDLPKGALPVKGVVFSYMKIADMNHDASFTLTADGAGVLGGDTSITYSVDQLQSMLDKKNVNTDFTESSSGFKGTAMPKTDAAGDSSVKNIAQGLYIVVETATPSSVTETVTPFLVSLPMTMPDRDAWNYDVEVYPKNQVEHPTIDKKVKDNGDDVYTDATSSTSGDTLSYSVDIVLPKVTTAATKYSSIPFTDGQQFGTYENVKVVCGDKTVDAASMISEDGKSLSGDLLTLLGADTVNTAAKDKSATIKVTYDVKNVDLKVGGIGEGANDNKATVAPKRQSADDFETVVDKAPVYSFGIDLTKQLEGGNGNVEQARFTLQNDSNNSYLKATATKTGEYKVTGVTDNQLEATQFAPAADGKLLIKGIEADEYTLVETQAPSGFSLMKDPEKVKISFDYKVNENADASKYDAYVNSSTATVNAKEVSLEGDDTATAALVPVTIVNKKDVVLPLTGGASTVLVTLIGVGALGAGIATMVRRKKDTEPEQ